MHQNFAVLQSGLILVIDMTHMSLVAWRRGLFKPTLQPFQNVLEVRWVCAAGMRFAAAVRMKDDGKSKVLVFDVEERSARREVQVTLVSTITIALEERADMIAMGHDVLAVLMTNGMLRCYALDIEVES